MNIWDFENADIEKLAIHVRESVHPSGLRTIYFNRVIGTDFPVLGGRGVLYHSAFIDGGAGPTTIKITDGKSAQGQLLAMDFGLLATNASYPSWPGCGVPFLNGLFLTDNGSGDTVTGRVVVGSHPVAQDNNR